MVAIDAPVYLPLESIMLTLKLTLDNGQVTVCANEAQSHSFSLHDLRLNDAELKAFVLNPRLYGSRLFKALFKDGSAAKSAFDELSKQTARTIVLVLESPELDSVAWEYAYNEVNQEYVVEDCAFMRTLPENERPANGRLKESVERVSLLFIPANPLADLNAEPMRALDVDGEWREMTRHITASHAPFDLLQMRPATPEQLQTSMARFRDGLAVHFSGHGAAMKDGTILLFERENGTSNPLGAQEFIHVVKDKAGIVFLSACQSAAAEKTEFGNLARGLVKSGVPFALGMQFNLPDPFAPVISGQFYNWLAQGHAIPEATMQARRAVKRENEFFVGMIALYAAHPDETGEINWRGSGALLVQTVRPADVSDLPSPASGLIGRQRELMRIGMQLTEGTRSGPLTVTLHGTGGIGKTALLWQSLLRFSPSFDLTLALALDPLPSLESILGRIERFLGLPSPCANETKERETLVRERLTSKRTLLGLDNFETLNYALNEKDSDEEKTAKSLHSFFKSLAANGVTLCVTSREVTNLPGETIEDIQGLTNENGGRLFQENVVRQKDEIYIEKTQQVSEMVGGHPLALRLLASSFDDQIGTTLDQYIEDLQSHLPKARDKWTEEDRHEGLHASFDFTMRNLVKMEDGQILQSALAQLSVFIAFFPTESAMLILESEKSSDYKHIEKIINILWEHSLLERITLFINNKSTQLYRLHPALSIFVKEIISYEENIAIKVENNYIDVMSRMANNALAVSEGAGLYSSPLFVSVIHFAFPDILNASYLKKDKNALVMRFHAGFIQKHFGNFDDALRLYEEVMQVANDSNQDDIYAASLHEVASIFLARGDIDKAANLYKQSLEIQRDLGNIKGAAVTIGEIAKVEEIHGNIDAAINLFQHKLSVMQELGDQREIAVAFQSLADIYSARGEFGEANKYYAQSLEIYEKIGDLKSKSVTLSAMAHIFAVQGDYTEALGMYNKSISISENLMDIKGKSVTLHEIANILLEFGDLDEALRLYEQSLEAFDKLGMLREKSSSLYSIARIWVIQGKLDKALIYFENSLQISESLGDLSGKATSLYGMAGIYKNRSDTKKAMRLYNQALDVFENLGDLQGKSSVLNAMANIFISLDNFDRAVILYNQSIDIDDKLGNIKGKSVTLANLAYIHRVRGDLKKALKLYEQSLEIDDKTDNLRGKSSTLHELSYIYRALGKLDEAKKLLQQSLEIKEKLGDLHGKATSLHAMAYIHRAQGDLPQATNLYQQAMDIFEEIGDLKNKAITSGMISKTFWASNNYRKAIVLLLEGLTQLIELEIEPRIQQAMASDMVSWRKELGAEKFDAIWKEGTRQDIPGWLAKAH